MATAEPKTGTTDTLAPIVLIRHDQKAGGPTRMPPRKTLIIQLVAVKPTEETDQWDLDARLKVLEAAVRHSQEMPEAEEPAKRDL